MSASVRAGGRSCRRALVPAGVRAGERSCRRRPVPYFDPSPDSFHPISFKLADDVNGPNFFGHFRLLFELSKNIIIIFRNPSIHVVFLLNTGRCCNKANTFIMQHLLSKVNEMYYGGYSRGALID